MHKRSRKPSCNLKTQALPQPHGAFVAAHHKVELHCAKSARPRVLQRMLAHRPRHAAPARPWSCHISSVCDVPTPALLIRAQYIRPDDLSFFFRHEYGVLRRGPIRQSVLALHVPRQGVGLPAANHRLEDFPDCVRIACRGFPYEHYVKRDPHLKFLRPRAILPTWSALRETAPSRSALE